jgi:hypothetical protein
MAFTPLVGSDRLEESVDLLDVQSLGPLLADILDLLPRVVLVLGLFVVSLPLIHSSLSYWEAERRVKTNFK